MDRQKRIQLFQKQSYEWKKNEVTRMLEAIQGKHQVLEKLYIQITTQDVPENIVHQIYEGILNLEELCRDKETEQAVNQLQKTHDYLKNLQRKEDAEKAGYNADQELESSLDAI